MRNVIILTAGLAGSSVLTSLLHQKGYWVGVSTIKKDDYNTWENVELVDLNNQLLRDIGFKENWAMEFQSEFIDRVSEGAQHLNKEPYRGFADRCAQCSPWVWKDPRLWLTIRYWRQFIDLENTCFLVIRRESLQAWISTALRRQIQTMAHERRYIYGIQKSIMDFLDESNLPYVDILYEDLLIHPEPVINSINQLTGAQISVNDLESVFRGKLYRRQHGPINLLKATAIYLKNYSQRYR